LHVGLVVSIGVCRAIGDNSSMAVIDCTGQSSRSHQLQRIVIVGAGPGGLSAARNLSKAANVTIIDS
jgi:ribulose 1,5-bisphosphate synthetase/thiazole synthase